MNTFTFTFTITNVPTSNQGIPQLSFTCNFSNPQTNPQIFNQSPQTNSQIFNQSPKTVEATSNQKYIEPLGHYDGKHHFRGCSCQYQSQDCSYCVGGCGHENGHCTCVRVVGTVRFEPHFGGCVCNDNDILENSPCDRCPCGSGNKYSECNHKGHKSPHIKYLLPRGDFIGVRHFNHCTCEHLETPCDKCPGGCGSQSKETCSCDKFQDATKVSKEGAQLHFAYCQCSPYEIFLNKPCNQCPCGSGQHYANCKHPGRY